MHKNIYERNKYLIYTITKIRIEKMGRQALTARKRFPTFADKGNLLTQKCLRHPRHRNTDKDKRAFVLKD